jgi:hypothetical protein
MLTNCGTLGDALLSNSQLFARRHLVTIEGIEMHVGNSVIVSVWQPSIPERKNTRYNSCLPFVCTHNRQDLWTALLIAMCLSVTHSTNIRPR